MPPKTMELVKNSWQRQLKDDLKAGKNRPMFPSGGDCKIDVCNATLCKHNKNNKCTLPTVNIDKQGRCMMFT
tara:strand:- start:322 stop:537 length:216 start_codon:yes stop_codon:yes gene_type:complete